MKMDPQARTMFALAVFDKKPVQGSLLKQEGLVKIGVNICHMFSICITFYYIISNHNLGFVGLCIYRPQSYKVLGNNIYSIGIF